MSVSTFVYASETEVKKNKKLRKVEAQKIKFSRIIKICTQQDRQEKIKWKYIKVS
jgi:hypothetical protein